MTSFVTRKTFNTALCLILGLLIAGSALAFQEKTGEALQNKYAPIIGTYEFDLSEMGGDVIYLEILIKEGELWGDSGDGMPVTLNQSVEGEFEFDAKDPESRIEYGLFISQARTGNTAAHRLNIFHDLHFDRKERSG